MISTMRPSLSALNRFRDKFVRSEGCWLWLGSTDTDGYGFLKDEGRNIGAHRLSFYIFRSDPGDLFVLHNCDNPPCVNPDHLFLGDHSDNMKDRARKGRTNVPVGSKCNLTLYQDDLIDAVKALKDTGRTQQSVADEFGVTRSYVGQLWQGKRRNAS